MKKIVSWCVASASLCIALPSNAALPPEMDRYARQLGGLCGLDMRTEESVRHVQKQPAFFWLIGRSASKKEGMSPADFQSLRAAVICNEGKNILVDEVAAEKALGRAPASK